MNEMIGKLTQKLERGFAPWKEMFFEKEGTLNEMGGKLIFAGSEKEDDNTMHVIMEFPSPEGLKAFASHEELKAKRAAAGAILETTVVTILSSESFTSTS